MYARRHVHVWSIGHSVGTSAESISALVCPRCSRKSLPHEVRSSLASHTSQKSCSPTCIVVRFPGVPSESSVSPAAASGAVAASRACHKISSPGANAAWSSTPSTPSTTAPSDGDCALGLFWPRVVVVRLVVPIRPHAQRLSREHVDAARALGRRPYHRADRRERLLHVGRRHGVDGRARRADERAVARLVVVRVVSDAAELFRSARRRDTTRGRFRYGHPCTRK